MSVPDSAVNPARCPVCSSLLAAAGWCPRCALDGADSLGEIAPTKTPGIFTIAGHVILGELGRGGAGLVYRAQQQNPAREVALKILLPHEAASENSRARFRLEASTVATLDHPAILPVLTVGEHDGLPYFTMKLCAGGSLAERIARYRGAWRDIGLLIATLADAVQHAHMRGVLHRDLKPGNVLFDEADRPFVGDFGIAKSLAPTNQGTAPLTRPQVVMGTQGYLAPEILTTGVSAATLSADVYALGAILYELLSGAPPVAGTTPRPPAKSTLLQHDLFVIALKCLRAEPAARYASAGALADDLRAALAGRAIAARPMPPLAHAVAWARRNPALASLTFALVVTLAAGGAFLFRANRQLGAALTHSQSSLAESLVAQAGAVRHIGHEGQRYNALELLQRAAQIKITGATRDEAIAALAIPDWSKLQELRPWTGVALFAVPSPDFTDVLTEDGKGNFSLRSTSTGVERWSWHGADKSMSQPVFSRDGRWVAVRLMDDTVHVLSAADGKFAFELKGRPYAFKSSVTGYGRDLDFSPDGTHVAITRPEGGVTFHRLPGGEQETEWVSPTWVSYLAYSPDGSRLAAGGGAQRTPHDVAIIDPANGHAVLERGLSARVELLLWSPDSQVLAWRVTDGMTELHASTDLTLRATVPDREALYGQFLLDGNHLLLATRFNRTRLWDLASMKVQLEIGDTGRTGSWFSGDPVRLWRSFSAGPVVLATLEESAILRAGNTAITEGTVSQLGGVAPAADGYSLAIGARGGGGIYDTRFHRDVAHFAFPDPTESASVRIDDAAGVAWINSDKSGLWRQPLARGSKDEWTLGAPRVAVDGEKDFWCADLHRASGQLALVRPGDGTVKIIDVRTQQPVARWRHLGAAMAAFSPDGTQLVVNSRYPTETAATVYNAKTGALIRTIGSKASLYVAWSPDGHWIYEVEADYRGKLWRTSNWTEGPNLLTYPTDHNRAGAFSPDSQWLAIVDSYQETRVIDLATGKNIFALGSPESMGLISGLHFLTNDRLCVVNSEGRVHTWDLAALRRELEKSGLGWADSR